VVIAKKFFEVIEKHYFYNNINIKNKKRKL